MAESQEDQMQSVVTCAFCEETAEHFCKTCQERLCLKCRIIHSENEALSDHEVVLLSFTTLSVSVVNKIISRQVCSKHIVDCISICCGDCEKPICEKCILPEHSGHRVISITDLIKQMEPKLHAKYSAISFQLPKYVDKLKEIKDMRFKVVKNSCLLRKDIENYFLTVQCEIENYKKKLIKDIDENEKSKTDELILVEEKIEESVRSMKALLEEYKNWLPNEKLCFILSGNCNLATSMPERFPEVVFPELLRYERDLNMAAALNSLCGRLYEGIIVHPNYIPKGLKAIGTGYEKLKSLAYRWQDDTFWLHTREEILQIDRDGNVLHKISVYLPDFNEQPIAVTKLGSVIYRQKKFILGERNLKGENRTFFRRGSIKPLCLWARKNGGILVGYFDEDKKDGGLLWLTENGVIEREMRNFPPISSQKLTNMHYIAENVNGDICFSDRVVDVYDSKLHIRFSYNGSKGSLFIPHDICTDGFGNIIIADNRSKVHILNIDGSFLNLLTIPGLNAYEEVSLTIDRNRCLCVGGYDGKIRFIDYSNAIESMQSR